jgi:hypothetical protein
MQSEKINNDTALHPPSLTDKELISFAERFLDTGMPLSFQKELLFRFDKRING